MADMFELKLINFLLTGGGVDVCDICGLKPAIHKIYNNSVWVMSACDECYYKHFPENVKPVSPIVEVVKPKQNLLTIKHELTIPCFNCNKTHSFMVSTQQLHELEKGEKKIQEVLPDFSPEDREMFISGCCPECWIKLFGEEED